MFFWTDGPTSANNAYLMASHDDFDSLLKRVSRSFYISMHYLPKAMRGPIGLGYLWARLSDTLADTHDISVAQRLDILTDLQKSIAEPTWDISLWCGDAQKLAAHVSHPGEKQLLVSANLLQAATCNMDPIYQTMVRTVMEHILDGQRNDLTFFVNQQSKTMNANELDMYCYQVAGSVGEFWTDVGYQACKDFSAEPLDQMKQVGRMYGQGLQLVNILRDFSKDQLLGRCYLPFADQASSQMQVDTYQQWIETARSYLHQGLWYASRVQTWRARSSSVLPALIGLKTLDQLALNPRESMAHPKKISRRQVRRSMVRAVFYPLDKS